MSRSRILQQHIEQLKEIRSILHALKNIAFMEVHKLNQLQQAQNNVVRHIATVSTDFLQFYRERPNIEPNTPSMLVIIGSERGFCGNFNDSLIEYSDNLMPADIIALGSRLCARMENKRLAYTALAGANSHEEIGQVLNSLTTTVSSLQQRHEFFSLSALYHQGEHSDITLQPLLQPFNATEQAGGQKQKPLLNLEPTQFLFELADQYLLSTLQAILLTSLNAENTQRMQHLDNAVRHLDQATARLRQLTQIHRQEEITEEIEVILLNAENPS